MYIWRFVTTNTGIFFQSAEAPDVMYGDKHVPVKRKKKLEEEEKRIFLKACTAALGNNETDNDAFGKFISKKLEKISNAEQRMYAESLITKVTNYAILNKLTEFTDIMANYSLLRDANTGLSNYSSSTSVSVAYQPTTEVLTATLPNTSASEYYENVGSYETID